MAGTVSLDVDSFQHSDVPFDAQVNITGVPAGSSVTVTLTQTRGRPPLFSGSQVVSNVGGGVTSVSFGQITLAGPTLAVLVADAADDQGTPYTADAERVQVL
jgi:hypothetical protein